MKQETRMSTASRETSAPMLTYARGRFGYTPYARGRFADYQKALASGDRIPHMHVGGLQDILGTGADIYVYPICTWAV